MTTMKAVVRYALDATGEEKLRALRMGLEDVAWEMRDLGQPWDAIAEDFEEAVENAASSDA